MFTDLIKETNGRKSLMFWRTHGKETPILLIDIDELEIQLNKHGYTLEKTQK